MAVSMAVRSSVLVLVVLAVASTSYGQTCNTTLLEAVQATPQLAQLAAVIAASGLSNLVNTTDNVTVIAPDNNAFNGTNGLLSVLAQNNLNLTQVTANGSNRAASILLYHIVPTPALAANLTNGEKLPTALGSAYNLTVSKTTNATTTTVTFIGAGSNATVLIADIKVCNSVVHVVNNVLLPATTLTAIPIYNASSSGANSTVPMGSNDAASLSSSGLLALGLSAFVAALISM